MQFHRNAIVFKHQDERLLLREDCKMKKLLTLMTCLSTFFFLIVALVSCGGSGGGSAGGTGELSIGLTDAPAGDYEAIYVTIDKVEVKQALSDGENGWITVGEPKETFNLLSLAGGVIAHLGATDITSGHYNQLRLILGTEPDNKQNILANGHPYANYLIKKEGFEQIELKVPSGVQTGIKLVNGFDVIVSGSTDLVLDFDAMRSVVQAGKSGNWLLKPTIKVVESVVNSVRGKVDTIAEGISTPIAGATISAQRYDAEDGNVEYVAGTLSDDAGNYFMYLPLNATEIPYQIVATKTENQETVTQVYKPECSILPSTKALGYTANFIISLAETTGTITASVTGLPSAEESALFSIRQDHVTCGLIEVAQINVNNDASSQPASLPAGTYKIVVSADGQDTQIFESVVVEEGKESTLQVDFTPTAAQ